ncbi:MAG: restriction endonuclease subunit S [Methylococcus sp.]
MSRELKGSGIPWICEIPGSWNIRRVKDDYRVVGGGTPDAQEIDVDHTIPWATPADFSDAERLLTKTARSISAQGHGKIGKALVKTDGILLSCRAPAGKVALPAISLSFNQGCKGLSPRNKGILRDWYFYALVDQREQIEELARGATFLEISGDALKRVLLSFPPLDEQRRIAAWLDLQTCRIDKRIELLGNKRELLGQLRRNLIAETVAKGLSTKPMLPTGLEPLPIYPQGWTPTQAKRLLRFITSGSRGWAEYYADDGDYFLRIGNLTRETIDLDLSDVQHVALPAKAAEGKRTRIREGDMLVSITADLGSIAIAPKLDTPAYVNQHIALCRPRDSVHPRWLGYAMLSEQSKRQLMSSGYGGTKIQLGLDDVRNVWLSVPPLDEQCEIAAYLDQRLGKIARQIALIDRLEALLKEQRKALIHEAVTGKIDLSNYEPPTQAA